jgi:type IV secretory pathway ATPase VirB11/archaellum biosynthesis ATPase
MKHNVQIVQCHSNRCDSCPKQFELECQELVPGNQDKEKSTILIERNRGLFHIRFSKKPILTDPPWSVDKWESIFVGKDSDLFDKMIDMVDIYRVGPYVSLFFNEKNSHQIRYVQLPVVRTALELSLLSNLGKDSMDTINPVLGLRESVTDQLDRVYTDLTYQIRTQIPEINENTRTRIAQIAAHRTNILGRIFPILMDEMTEEVYLDGPNTSIYFDHQIMGRCITSSTFNESEVPRIVTFLRSESNLHLDRSNPSLKMELIMLGSVLRLSASVPPLSADGLNLEIRRARKQPFTIRDLIENNTITKEAAAILLLAVASRLNITITGGPGTGKTTLLNALDSVTPRWWRKVYIEDAIESRTSLSHHQVRLQVDPVDEQHKRMSKSEEIVKCLHRSPDYLILGEIQTVEHSKALFQAVAAGLRSIQTCHSDSAASLVSRWIFGHNIEKSNLGLMDLIVTLERPKPGESTRHVKEIVEIRKGVQNGLLTFLGINIVYDSISKSAGSFAEDGAFRTLARNLGIKNHEQSLNSLIATFHNYNENMEELSESMWAYGHPMKFIA